MHAILAAAMALCRATAAQAAPVAYVMQPAISSVARGADDLLARKDNQRSLAEETARWFDSPEASALPVPAPCRSSRPPMPITAASRPAAIGSAMTRVG